MSSSPSALSSDAAILDALIPSSSLIRAQRLVFSTMVSRRSSMSMSLRFDGLAPDGTNLAPGATLPDLVFLILRMSFSIGTRAHAHARAFLFIYYSFSYFQILEYVGGARCQTGTCMSVDLCVYPGTKWHFPAPLTVPAHFFAPLLSNSLTDFRFTPVPRCPFFVIDRCHLLLRKSATVFAESAVREYPLSRHHFS